MAHVAASRWLSPDQVPGLDQYCAALDTERLVHTHMRAADPSTDWIASEVVFEHAIEQKNLFACVVAMRIETSGCCPAHPCGVFSGERGKRQDLKPLDQGLMPSGVTYVDHNAFQVIGLYVSQLNK